MKYVDKSVKYFTDSLAAKRPTPGGGSVVALLGALGCGLLSMVASFTLAREGFNGYKERAKRALRESEELRKKLLSLIDEDIVAYERLSNALKRYRGNTAKIQPSVKKAAVAPSKVCGYVHRAARVCLDLVYAGNKPLLCDICAAIYTLDAAFESALLNIETNLKLVLDRQYTIRKMQQYTMLHRHLKEIKTEVLQKAKERMME